MCKLAFAAVLLLAVHADSVVRRQADSSTIAVPPDPTSPPAMDANTTADSGMMMMTTADSDPVVVPDSNDTTTQPPPVVDVQTTMMAPDMGDDNMNTTAGTDMGNNNNNDTTTDMPEQTTTPLPCQLATERIAGVLAFTQSKEFKELPQNEQIVVYEMLAAGEGCKMTAFINPPTAERIFRLLTDLPLRMVYTFVSFVSESLANEGVVVPE